jgi:excisionase family DNA binding protein
MGRLLTVEELSQALRCSRAKAYSMLDRGEIPSIRVGHAIRIPEDGLEAYIESQITPRAAKTWKRTTRRKSQHAHPATS